MVRPGPSAPLETAEGAPYDDRIARRFLLASLAWGLAAMAMGLFVALELLIWQVNLAPALGFGRMRPVHTSTAVFAFAGNMIFAGIYYSSQRLLRVRLPSGRLGAVHFWSWQLVALAGAFSTPLGIGQGKELAELEWPIDILVAVSWLAFAAGTAAMVRRRNVGRLPIATWFTIAAIIAFFWLHVVGSLAVPVSLAKSYSLFAGTADELIQSWYAHAGIRFFLTVPVMGLVYAFLPAAAGRPIHSHRLAVVHFWSLLFVFGWAAPCQLLNTALPDWAQSAGTAFGILLWTTTWAGVANGFLTLRGAWSRLRVDPVLRFFCAALLFHALAGAQATVLATRTVSGLAHYTDWIVGHAHAIALGWVGLVAAGLFYWMVPRLWGARLHSPAAADAHFYMAVVGTLVYLAAMWIAGATQGLMWRAEKVEGGLAYSFVETLLALRVAYWARLAGGLLYAAGFALMVWNLWRTMRAGRPVDGAVAEAGDRARPATGLARIIFARPVLIAAAVIALAVAAGFTNPIAALALLFIGLFLALGGIAAARDDGWHRRLEGSGLAFAILVAATLLVGGLAEILPILVSRPDPVPGESEPYSALQLEGRDVYVAEGCRNCHSQMIRPFLWEVARYGEVSSAAESLHDRPPLWGSRRIGPDLARIGGRYPHLWHYQHLVDPRSVAPGSTMPPYAHLSDRPVDLTATPGKMRALRRAGVPYPDRAIENAAADALAEARAIADDLAATGGVALAPDSEMVALIAYLQRLGQPPAGEPR